MRILSLIAGAGDMFCGSCLRDNSLAGALRKLGHDAVLVPLYTPVRTDDINYAQRRIFFGGISIYLEQLSGFFRRLPKSFDRFWDSPSVIKAFTGRGVEVDPKQLGELTVSMLRGELGNQRKEIEHLAEWLRHEPPFQLAVIPYTLLIGLAKPLRQATRAPILCGLQGEEFFLDNLSEPYRSEALALIRRQIRDVDAFIAVSHYGKRHMSQYLRIPEERIHVVPLGVDVSGCETPAPRRSGPPRIGFFSRIAPEKGLHLLVDAYIQLRKSGQLSEARLEAAGYLSPANKRYLTEQETKLAKAGFYSEFRYRGAPERPGKLEFLRSLDFLVMPADFDEPKGLPLLEALAAGIPVIAPNRGSFTEMSDATGGVLLIENNSPAALADSIRTLAHNPHVARQLAESGYESVHRGWTLEHMARRTVDVYSQFAR